MQTLTQWALKMDSNVEGTLSKIGVKADGVAMKMAGVQGSVSKLSNSFSGLKSIIAGAFSTIAVSAFLNKSLKAYDAQEKANAQLIAGLNSTGAISGKTFAQLEAQASKLQRMTLFEDNVIMGAQKMLLTFTNIRGEIYDKSIPAILDLATKMGSDPTQAALQLGKALNDPIKGISALSRVGIQFSQDQESMITKLVKTNQLAKAQEIILGELAVQFGGAAAANAKAGLGPLIQAQNAFGDVMEKVGLVAARVFMKALPYIYDFIDLMDRGVTWVKNNWPLVTDIFKSVGIAIAATAGALLIWKTYTIGLTIAQLGLNAALLANPVGLIIVGVMGVVTAIVMLWQRCEQFRGFLTGFWEFVKSLFSNISQLIVDVFGGWKDMIAGIITFDPSQFMGGLEKVFKSITGTVGKLGTEAGDAWSNGWKKGADQVIENLAVPSELANSLSGNTSGLFGEGDKTPIVDEALEKGTSSITEGSKQVRNVNVSISKLIEKIEFNNVDIRNRKDATDLEEKVIEIIMRAVQGSEVAMSN